MKVQVYALCLLCFIYCSGLSQSAKKNNSYGIVVGYDISNKIILPKIEDFYSASFNLSLGTSKEESKSSFSTGVYLGSKGSNMEFGLKAGFMFNNSSYYYQDDRKAIQNQNYYYELRSDIKQRHTYFIPCLKKTVSIDKLELSFSIETPVVLYKGDTLRIFEKYDEYSPGSLVQTNTAELRTAIFIPKSKSLGIGPGIGIGYKLGTNLTVLMELSTYFLYSRIDDDQLVSLKLKGIAQYNNSPTSTYQYYGSGARLEKEKLSVKGFSNLNPQIRFLYSF
jgi:hypothetical protein